MLYAVGDIHGCPGELLDALGLLRSDARRHGTDHPRVAFVGDYIDRGPDILHRHYSHYHEC